MDYYAIKRLRILARNYRRAVREDMWECPDTEELVFNEFLKGKAEGFEKALELLHDIEK